MQLNSEVQNNTNEASVDIVAELSWEEFSEFRPDALEKLRNETEIKGFRTGQAPDDVLVNQVGEEKILEEMAQQAISKAYPELLKKHEIDAIGRPQVSITKIADDNPLGFTITTSIMPETQLPEYKQLATEAINETKDDSGEVTDEELENAINEIRQMRKNQMEQDQSSSEEEAPDDTANDESEDGDSTESKDESEASNEEAKAEQQDEQSEETNDDSSANSSSDELPELTDEYVKTLGDFETVEDFKEKLKQNLKEEKANKAQEKKRINIIEKIMDQTEVEVPETLIDYELEKMMQQMEHDVSMQGMQFDDYLQKIEKTKEDLKSEWRDTAYKRAKMHLTVNAIAAREEIEPTEEEIKPEVDKLMEQYKDMEGIKEENVRGYVSGILTNQKVFDFLESQAGGEESKEEQKENE